MAPKPKKVPQACRAFDFISSQARPDDVSEEHAPSDSHLSNINKTMFDFLDERIAISTSSQVMDVGCEWGKASLAFRDAGAQITCVDGAPNALRWCEQFNIGTRWHHCDLDKPNLPLIPNGYDAIYGSEVLKYLKSPQHLLRQAIFRLKPGGVAVFTADIADSPKRIPVSAYPGALNPHYSQQAIVWAHPKKTTLDILSTNTQLDSLDIIETDYDKHCLAEHEAKKFFLIMQKNGP